MMLSSGRGHCSKSWKQLQDMMRLNFKSQHYTLGTGPKSLRMTLINGSSRILHQIKNEHFICRSQATSVLYMTLVKFRVNLTMEVFSQNLYNIWHVLLSVQIQLHNISSQFTKFWQMLFYNFFKIKVQVWPSQKYS